MLTEGTTWWGRDRWLYVVQGGRLVRSNYYRYFPSAAYPNVYDIYTNGRFVKRVTTAAGTKETFAEDVAQLQMLITTLNQLEGARAAQTAATSGQSPYGASMTLGGYVSNPGAGPNALTVTSYNLQNTRMAGAATMINMTLQNRVIAAGGWLN